MTARRTLVLLLALTLALAGCDLLDRSTGDTKEEKSSSKSKSDKAEKVEVPDLFEMTEEEAAEALDEVGLGLGDVAERSDDEVDEGAVVAQSPDAGKKADKGDAVDIEVSSGPGALKAPDVLNALFEWYASSGQDMFSDEGYDAKQKAFLDDYLEPYGLKWKVEYFGPEGDSFQEPEAGTEMAPGSTITLHIVLAE